MSRGHDEVEVLVVAMLRDRKPRPTRSRCDDRMYEEQQRLMRRR